MSKHDNHIKRIKAYRVKHGCTLTEADQAVRANKDARTEIDRIKAYRAKHKCGFKEAYDAIMANKDIEVETGIDDRPQTIFKFSNDLIKAYKGYYENEPLLDMAYEAGEATENAILQAIQQKIVQDPPKRRLEIYLEWNGILGYSSRLYEIATGEL